MNAKKATTDGIRPKASRKGVSSERSENVIPSYPSYRHSEFRFQRDEESLGKSGGGPSATPQDDSAESPQNDASKQLPEDAEPSEEILITEPQPQVTAEEFFKKSPKPNEDWILPVSKVPSSRRWFILGGMAGLIFVVTLVVLLSTVFARTTLTVKPRVENIALEDILIGLDVSVSKVLAEGRVLPAERLIFNRKETGEFESTGKEIIAEKARGKVRIYNSFSSSPQGLVANTRFLTVNGVLYRLPRAITIPGAKIEEGKIVPQFIEVDLVADKPGGGSNLSGEMRLSIPGFQGTPKYDGFYAIAPEGFSGGFEGEATVVSGEDIKRAEEAVTKKVYDELNAEMSRKAPPEFTFVEKLREIEITKVSSPRADTRRDKFTVEAEAEGRAFFFRESDLLSLLRDLILKEDKTKELMENTADFTYQIRTADYEKGKAAVSIRGSIKSKAVIPEREIAMLIKGKKEGSIVEALKTREELAQFSVSIFPPWRSTAPNDESKIRFVIQNP